MKSLIDILELSDRRRSMELVEHRRATSSTIPPEYAHKCDGKILATLFFEPSTRTRLSFESAMLRPRRQGARLLGGEQLVRCQGRERGGHRAHRQLLLRTSSPCATPRRARRWWPPCTRSVPVINAGDGGHNHPTQTLTDLLTIHREKGRFEQPDRRPLRRPQVRPHGALAYLLR